MKLGNTELQQHWEGARQEAQANITRMDELLSTTNDTTLAYQRYLKIIDDVSASQTKFDVTVQQTERALRRSAEAAEAANRKQMAAGGVSFVQEMAKQADENAKAVAKSYTEMAKAGVAASKEIANAFAKDAAEQQREAAAKQKQDEEIYIRQLVKAYNELADAQKRYKEVLKDGDEKQIAQQEKELEVMREKLTTLAFEAREKDLSMKSSQKWADVLEKANKAEVQFQRDVEKTTQALKDQAAQQQKAANEQLNKDALNATTEEYRRLTQAYREHLEAFKAGNAEGVKYWEDESLRAKASLDSITQNTEGLALNGETKEKLIQIGKDAAAAEEKHRVALQGVIDKQKEQNQGAKEAEQNMQRMVAQAERWIATMVVMRGLKNMWDGMVKYAKSYYDAMNEIRIVTGYTEEQAEHLGASYRALAADMSVSSQEIAKAAVEYWRQGLDESQVNERLKYTTVYAKISSMDFKEAAELMTAATNSMGIAADRVADVWAYLGDASASGADEIGTAMQKVSAVADQAGISFEWLGSYIATLSEKTRLAPEAIGTAMNSILSRLQQIKQKGFNDEDVYKINDIAKALGTLEKPIALMDEATGEWRAFPDILNDIADQWANLTDKEQAYIATTMGGTKQRNFMLTLLKDLSKAAEGGSRAWELYTGAQNAAGVAMEKYAIYEESVEAAQGRLNAALEEFYASIMDGGVLKNWYDGLAGVVNILNTATDATGGWNIKLTA